MTLPVCRFFGQTRTMKAFWAAMVLAVVSQEAEASCVIHSDAFSWSPIGHVDDEGRVHDTVYGFHIIGRIDEEGKIHDSAYGYHPIARVDDSGRIHDSSYGHNPIGRVEENGKIHDHAYSWHPIGRGQDCKQRQAGAGGFLLLLKSKK